MGKRKFDETMLFGYADKLTTEQQEYVDAMLNSEMTIVDAIAGSGKTTLAVAAAKLLGKDLIYVFAPVQEGKMGFRPGSQGAKELEYHQPLIDALKEIGENPMNVIYDEESEMGHKHMKHDDVWVYPRSHIFARGTNLKECVVIIDEAQNFTRGELKKVLTRVLDSATVIMIGHTGQCDLEDPTKSGFEPYMNHFRNEEYVSVCNLTVNFRGKVSRHADKLRW